MAEGRAGGAAGLFAKQVQKKFSRAQEKVGGWEPRLRPDAAAGCAGHKWLSWDSNSNSLTAVYINNHKNP